MYKKDGEITPSKNQPCLTTPPNFGSKEIEPNSEQISSVLFHTYGTTSRKRTHKIDKF